VNNSLSPKLRSLIFPVLILLVQFPVTRTLAATGRANANGFWNVASTWSFGGTNRIPTCSDTVTIPAGRTVTVNSQQDYTACGGSMAIIVYGTLQFTNGNKLDLPSGSKVYIMNGGVVKKSGAGGGSSTLISTCGAVLWKAGDGDLFGSAVLGSGTLLMELIAFTAQSFTDRVILA
jgi:hypothetical protein